MDHTGEYLFLLPRFGTVFGQIGQHGVAEGDHATRGMALSTPVYSYGPRVVNT